jgi:hypothetical protein
MADNKQVKNFVAKQVPGFEQTGGTANGGGTNGTKKRVRKVKNTDAKVDNTGDVKMTVRKHRKKREISDRDVNRILKEKCNPFLNLEDIVEKHGKRYLRNFVLIDLREGNKNIYTLNSDKGKYSWEMKMSSKDIKKIRRKSTKIIKSKLEVAEFMEENATPKSEKVIDTNSYAYFVKKNMKKIRDEIIADNKGPKGDANLKIPEKKGTQKSKEEYKRILKNILKETMNVLKNKWNLKQTIAAKAIEKKGKTVLKITPESFGRTRKISKRRSSSIRKISKRRS